MSKILIERGTGKKYLIKHLDDSFHCKDGAITRKDLNSKKKEVISNKGKKFLLLEASFVDLWENFKRGPQVVLPKDIGLIITKTGVNAKSKVVDAGGGSGSLCSYLANVCGEVVTYEVQKEFIQILEFNKKLASLNNLKIKNKDIYSGISEKNLDLVTLDLAQPWRVLESAEKALKLGGWLVVYLPNIIQVKEFVDRAKRSCVKVLSIEELLERKWKFEDKILRPEYEMLGHTGFLIFCRRL